MKDSLKNSWSLYPQRTNPKPTQRRMRKRSKSGIRKVAVRASSVPLQSHSYSLSELTLTPLSKRKMTRTRERTRERPPPPVVPHRRQPLGNRLSVSISASRAEVIPWQVYPPVPLRMRKQSTRVYLLWACQQMRPLAWLGISIKNRMVIQRHLAVQAAGCLGKPRQMVVQQLAVA